MKHRVKNSIERNIFKANLWQTCSIITKRYVFNILYLLYIGCVIAGYLMIQNERETRTSSSEIGRFSQGVDMHSAFAQAVCQSLSEIDVHPTEVSHRPFDDECWGVAQTPDHILHQSLFGCLVEDLPPEVSGLTKIIIIHGIITIHFSAGMERWRTSGWTLLRSGETVREIIRCTSVVIYRHVTIPLIVHRGNRLNPKSVQRISWKIYIISINIVSWFIVIIIVSNINCE